MLFASVILFFIAIFLLAAITVAFAWMAFLRRREEQANVELELAPAEGEDAEYEFDPEQAERAASLLARQSLDSSLFRTDRLSSVKFWNNLLERFDFIEILRTHIEQAALPWSVGSVTLAMLLFGTTVLLAFAHSQPILGLLGGFGVGSIPYMIVRAKRAKRFDKFREGFPDTLDSLARALRAGYSLSSAVETVTAEANPIVAAEFRRLHAEMNLGMGWGLALENFSRRMPLVEVNLFASAVVLHSKAGGKLSEAVNSLAGNMREAMGIRGEVRALAAHGKLTGVILTMLPIGISIMMMVVSPDYMATLYKHPNGPSLIASAIACLIAAHFVIRKIVNIEI